MVIVIAVLLDSLAGGILAFFGACGLYLAGRLAIFGVWVTGMVTAKWKDEEDRIWQETEYEFGGRRYVTRRMYSPEQVGGKVQFMIDSNNPETAHYGSGIGLLFYSILLILLGLGIAIGGSIMIVNS